MITAATRAMNASSHTLGDLQTFAVAEPAEAQSYLQNVKQSFVATGRAVPPGLTAAIDAILNGPPNELGTRITANAAALAPYFPDQPQMWAQLQAQRAQTIGWEVTTPVTQRAVTGKIDPATFTLTTPAGAVYNLAASTRQNPSGLPAGWLVGFKDDGDAPLTVRGTMGSDGKTFLVEDYAPGSSADFTAGRVDAADPSLIQTARGAVRVTDPAFAAKLAKLPRLGVILPGAPVQQGAELVYAGNPDKYYALGRFGAFPGAAAQQQTLSNATAQIAMLQQQLAQYEPALTGLQAQLAAATLETFTQAADVARAAVVTAASTAQTAATEQATAGQALSAAQLALAAATAAATPGPQGVPPEIQAALNTAQNTLATAQQAYTTAASMVMQTSSALVNAESAATQADANVNNVVGQRASLQQQIDSYVAAMNTTREQLTAQQTILTQTQAALAAPAAGPDAIITGARGDFAYSTFSQKPINIQGEKEAARANHNDRMWALGSFTFDAQGTPMSFEAKYLSQPLGGGSLSNTGVAEADDWLAAVMTVQAGLPADAATPMGTDFDRHTP